ncbi:hypothetical protein Ab1vBOLIVR2_gp25 [Agrobacterium phage OLIVR2]|uniref:Uncharacterized protein n=1 Tax=Agrobacterium phage OLIVR1 TaxID=2723769 RepID=A0A858MU11_9CAUD|nr:hypothetical protein [Xanthomonas campestris]YP_010107059.1 hypothetical protein KNU98_gp084 [Agrobacterium phage OLIVR1]QIW87328.1 hypothetical protein Ab1vBOLIVR2_gp25 [Agrobacterium phage OLIVR2]QIW87435.1 hypothetical protein Ab1vBOLIVR3_gp25 [Agrobacterium phage OLIVR3]MCF8861619.1 hypothetical protein [Xanthomonas campestris pv. campestris]QIW87220.1 hypothetical protein Ab1vBOLIVR1_gp25 [Agrobacterium phage OLIVR1]
MKFRVHYVLEGEKYTKDVEADRPEDAAKHVRKTVQGAIVSKTKVVREA